MEAVSSDFIFFVVFIRQGIHICSFRHCLMECRIKYCYLRYAGHDFLACMDTDKVCRVMQGCKLAAFFDRFDNFWCDYYRVCEVFAAVYNTMANRIDFLHAFYNAVFLVCQRVQNHFYGNAVVFLVIVKNNSFFAFGLVFQSGTFDTDSFTQTLSHYLLRIQLVFQGGAAAIQYKNFHFFLSFFYWL